MGIAVKGRFAWIASCEIVAADIWTRTVRGRAVLILCRKVQITAFAQWQAKVRSECIGVAVVPFTIFAGVGNDRVVRQPSRQGHGVDLTNIFHFRDVLAKCRLRAAAHAFFQLDVDDASNSIGTILRSCTVAQHFEALNRQWRNGVEIDGGRATADRTVQVDESRLVTTLAVDEHQNLIRRKTAQCCRAQRVRSIRQRRLWEVERWHKLVQQLVCFGLATV